MSIKTGSKMSIRHESFSPHNSVSDSDTDSDSIYGGRAMEDGEKVKRCPKGQRRNKKTGLCEEHNKPILNPTINPIHVPNQSLNARPTPTNDPVIRLPVADVKTKNVPETVIADNKVEQPIRPVVLDRQTKKNIQIDVENLDNIPDADVDMAVKQKRCPKGFNKNKQGKCINKITGEEYINIVVPLTRNDNIPPMKLPITIPVSTIIKNMSSKQSPMDEQPAVEKPKRCPKGERRNTKTKKCEKKNPVEPVTIAPVASPSKTKTVKNASVPVTSVIEEDKDVFQPVKESSKIIEIVDNIQEDGSAKVSIEVPNVEETKQDNVDAAVDNVIPVEDIATSINIKEPSIIQNEPVVEEVQVSKDINYNKRNFEINEMKEEEDESKYGYLYPSLNDKSFNLKIAKRKEFNDTKYDGKIDDVKKRSNEMCDADFEFMPHQLFVKNFLSYQTPYNGLILYHGLGSGKTCSAIGISEEMRGYMKRVGMTHKILVVASPNVQSNFRYQLFDERKLVEINQGDDVMWNLRSCVGASLLKEINPGNFKGIPRKKVISSINAIINKYYDFMGYGQLSNYISDILKVDETKYSEKERELIEIKNIRAHFNNRLIIVDEFHNIRLTDENINNKKTSALLMKLAQHTDNLRFVFLSATPMYNSNKEIIWITNLLNLNDKRSTIEISEVFDKEGNWKPSKELANGTTTEDGKMLLTRKLTGYVSYVRGENPYTFPFRVYPEKFAPESSIKKIAYPKMQMNGKELDEPIKYVDVFVTKASEYQERTYSIIINGLKRENKKIYDMYGNVREMPSFENMESFGYSLLQVPLEALNIVYPNQELDMMIDSYIDKGELYDIEKENSIISDSVGKKGLANIMKYENVDEVKHNFEYKTATIKSYGPIFSPENLPKYSSKIHKMCESIRNSVGIVLIYSQYIDGGVIPISLALEEMGLSRYCSTPTHNNNLFKKQRTEQIDAITMKPRGEVLAEGESRFSPAKYIIITGDKSLSPSNAEDIKYATNPDNIYGEHVKVIIISKAGSEGLDFKNIRQVHIMEPWYNMNRIEQIIGRGVRNLSHCEKIKSKGGNPMKDRLPFEERNVEIYMHGTLFENTDEESADLYVYRLAEKKAIQIGKVTRLMKEVSVDCILNIAQTNFSAAKLMEVASNQNVKINVSSGKVVDMQIGDQPFTSICDYMDTCEHKCYPVSDVEIGNEDVNKNTYNTEFMKRNRDTLVERIRQLFREQVVYKKNSLIASINATKQYPIEQIYYVLTFMIDNKTEYLIDKNGRFGNLVNKGEYYLFQPLEISDENISIYDRTAPVEYKREGYYLEYPKKFLKEPVQVSNIVPKNEAEKIKQHIEEVEQEADTTTDVEVIIENMVNNYNTAYGNNVALKSGEKNWYKHANQVIKHLETIHKISKAFIEKCILDHMLDMMPHEQRLALVANVFGEFPFVSEDSLETKIINHVHDYFNKRLLVKEEYRGILLNKENSWKIFMHPDTNFDEDISKVSNSSENSLWKEATPEDYKLFDTELDRFDIEDESINDIVGFINMFKNREMVFKVKDVRSQRNNVGARCDEKRKGDVIKLVNEIIGKQMYDANASYLNFGFCVIMEIILRHYNDIHKNGKVYFMTPEETAINDIAKYVKKL